MTDTQTTPAPAETRRNQRLPLLAAAAVLVVAGVVGAIALTGGDDPASSPPLALSVPDAGGAALSSCLAFDPAVLAGMELAFDGTAVAVEPGTVTLEVTRWYQGGTAETVALSVPGGGDAFVNIDGVAFEQGERYLISASDGTVNFCGFSGPWSPELEAGFQQAFGG